MFYIAYGSNLSSKVRLENKNNFKFVKSLELSGYKLAFKCFTSENSYLTLDKDNYSIVNVVVYEISKEDEIILDDYEDVKHNLYSKEYIKLEINGKVEECLIYIMNKNARYCLPQTNYYNKVIDGYNEYGFNIKPLEVAIEEIANKIK